MSDKDSALTVMVEPLVSTHSHLREMPMFRPLIKLLVAGGVDTILPMPNTDEGLTTVDQVIGYRDRAVLDTQDLGCPVSFIPTIMVTENTTSLMIQLCRGAGIWDAKVYPRDRTTKSHNGVRHYQKLLPVLKEAGRQGMRVHFHPEHPDLMIGNRDAEYLFLPIADMVLNETDAVVIWEHGTDARCIPFWEEWARIPLLEMFGRFANRRLKPKSIGGRWSNW